MAQLIQHLIDGLDLRNFRLKLTSGLLPDTLLRRAATLPLHEGRVPATRC